jgi:hypothetical protein
MSDSDIFGDDRDDFFQDDESSFEDFEDFDSLDIGELDEDAPTFGEEEGVEEGAAAGTIFGLNRTFVLIGGIFAILICVGAVILLLVLANQGPTDIDRTVTSVYATNTFVAYALDLTETQNAAYGAETATAEAWTDTPSPTPSQTPTPTATEPLETPTSQIVFVTPTSGQGGGVSADAVAQTATALAQILAGGTPTPEVLVTSEGGAGGGFVTPTPQGELPTTGLFDEIGTGGVNSLATAGLAVLGLAAVMFIARRLRQ